jgi:signal transduction histidine kinase
MIESILKYFAIVYASRYFYSKIQNLTTTRMQKIADIIFSLLLALIIHFIRLVFPPITFLLIVLCAIGYSFLFFNQSNYATIISNLISIGMSNILSLFTLMICSFSSVLIRRVFPKYEKNLLLYFSAFLILQFLFMQLPFRSSRLKKGIPFISNAKFSSIGIILSVISILSASIFKPDSQLSAELIILLLIISICGIFLIFWWRNRITEKYVKEVNKRAFDALKNELMQKDKEILSLQKENDELSSIIHKDNKLIPAMELSVNELFESAIKASSSSEWIAQAKQIHHRLQTMASERSGILKTYERKTQPFPKTNILSIDSLMLYMFNRASKQNIHFDLNLIGDFSTLIDHAEFESDLLTMLADITENAILATNHSEKKNIEITLSNTTYFSITIQDSGIPFSNTIIKNLGIKRTTTHKNEGGSGIGLMTLWILSKKYHATIQIKEHKDNLFQKSISILFNEESKVIIQTQREELLSLQDFRNDIQFESIK